MMLGFSEFWLYAWIMIGRMKVTCVSPVFFMLQTRYDFGYGFLMEQLVRT